MMKGLLGGVAVGFAEERDCWGCFGVDFFKLGVVEVSVKKKTTVV